MRRRKCHKQPNLRLCLYCRRRVGHKRKDQLHPGCRELHAIARSGPKPDPAPVGVFLDGPRKGELAYPGDVLDPSAAPVSICWKGTP